MFCEKCDKDVPSDLKRGTYTISGTYEVENIEVRACGPENHVLSIHAKSTGRVFDVRERMDPTSEPLPVKVSHKLLDRVYDLHSSIGIPLKEGEDPLTLPLALGLRAFWKLPKETLDSPPGEQPDEKAQVVEVAPMITSVNRRTFRSFLRRWDTTESNLVCWAVFGLYDGYVLKLE